MKLLSVFSDERNKRVTHKDVDPSVDVELRVAASGSAVLDIPVTDRRKLAYVLSNLDLDEGVLYTTATFKAGVSTEYTLELVPGEPVVVPLDADVDTFNVTSNSLSAGTIRVVIL